MRLTFDRQGGNSGGGLRRRRLDGTVRSGEPPTLVGGFVLAVCAVGTAVGGAYLVDEADEWTDERVLGVYVSAEGGAAVVIELLATDRQTAIVRLAYEFANSEECTSESRAKLQDQL